MNDVAVSFEGVCHRYRKVMGLTGITLAIPSGCIAGVIGPDGVGKSTLLSLAAGVTRLQTGRLQVLGGDMRRPGNRRLARARIAYMPQGLGRNLYPTLSVAENLHFFGRLFGQAHGEREERIEELLLATGLAPFADRPVQKLSGGMKQKLGICAALIHDPDLLILDEPTTGIDPLSRRQFWDLIARMRRRRRGMSLIVATAYMEEAELFDWLAAMDAGRVVATGSPDEIKSSTGEPDFERAFGALLPPERRLAERAVPDLPLEAHDGPPAIEAENLTCRFGNFTAVDRVSFRIARGEIFGFLGSNGSGKSTTMKMLTGLLPASEGRARLFGRPLDADDMNTRRRVGYMSQSFSLYGELSVHQNLVLHARLFNVPRAERTARIDELMERFALAPVADMRPESLPLGIRQRLQLAVAVVHRPEILILDEPTSGVDPLAREQFWHSLIGLSRSEGVTIFLSTHFMSEAERCDRVSLMHAGRVLAVGSPEALKLAHGKDSLEDVFVSMLEKEAGASTATAEPDRASSPPRRAKPRIADPRRLWAYAWREALEIVRDPARLVFALAGPALLLITFGYGISFDVENLPFAVFDQDQSAQSRQLLDSFQSSRYFEERPPIASPQALDARLASGELKLAIEIPPNFGRDLLRGQQPEVAVWLDGAMPFRAETTRSYVAGVAQSYLAGQALRNSGREAAPYPISIEPRFRYNQAFRSANAIVPSVIMLMLVLIPAIMTALGVVKEKETGSIANFQATPVTKLEFLLGKQLPYVAIALLSFISLVLLTRFVFEVPIKGSLPTLVLGSLAYIFATTAFGLFLSSFVRSQVAAIFATAIVSLVPAVNFSGLLTPVATLTGAGRLIGLSFPAAWYQPVTVGVFTKGLGFEALWGNVVVLAAFAAGFLAAATLVLRKQKA
ncbi:ribosome-associated ATPase/putative transporter RbbA [Rhodoligotrophos ferricapiens]|uniref:ribosome-associated ATPase/putative transporter RbbA n=1 Tax=Rhodoligotrophos ferricapiens TaxID=3069264 RepID=UPI00315C69D7